MSNTGEKEYEIWREGYAATGERSTASFIGKGIGKTFEEAVINFRHPSDKYADWGGIKIHSKGDTLNLDTDSNEPDGYRRVGGKLCSWACRYFDNEADARKSCG